MKCAARRRADAEAGHRAGTSWRLRSSLATALLLAALFPLAGCRNEPHARGAAASVTASAAPVATTVTTVTIGTFKRPVGHVLRTEHLSHTRLRLIRPSGEKGGDVDAQNVRRDEVREVKDGRPRHLVVLYEHRGIDSSLDGVKTVQEADALAGLGFDLHDVRGRITIVPQQSAPPTDYLDASVGVDYPSLAWPSPLADWIGGNTYRVGQNVPELARGLAEMLASATGLAAEAEVQNARARLEQVVDGDAIFAIDFDVVIRGVTTPAKQKIVVRARDGFVKSIEVRMNMDITSPDDKTGEMVRAVVEMGSTTTCTEMASLR
jgi:hypothetical protein